MSIYIAKAFPFFQAPRYRKWQYHSDNKQKKRKYKIQKPKALPTGVFHLLMQCQGKRVLPDLLETPYESTAANNPEHRKTPQRINGEQSFSTQAQASICILRHAFPFHHNGTLTVTHPMNRPIDWLPYDIHS